MKTYPYTRRVTLALTCSFALAALTGCSTVTTVHTMAERRAAVTDARFASAWESYTSTQRAEVCSPWSRMTPYYWSQQIALVMAENSSVSEDVEAQDSLMTYDYELAAARNLETLCNLSWNRNLSQ